MKKILIGLALIALVATLILPARGQDIRDVAQQKDADITSSTSTGTDKHDLHSDTEKVGEAPRHAPALLESRHQPKVKKMSEGEINRLEERRRQLIRDRKAVGETAAIRAETVARAAGTPAERIGAFAEGVEGTGQKARASSITIERARADAERKWDATEGKELAKVERALKEGSTSSKEVRFHAPALLDSK